MNDLSGSAVEGGEGGPEHLVAVNDGLEGLAQRGGIQVALQAQGEGFEVGGIPLPIELMEEPEALLGEGEGEGCGSIGGEDGQQVGRSGIGVKLGGQVNQDREGKDLAER